MASVPDDTRFYVDVGEVVGEAVIELDLEDEFGLAFSGTLSLGTAHALIGALMVAVANARGQLHART